MVSILKPIRTILKKARLAVLDQTLVLKARLADLALVLHLVFKTRLADLELLQPLCQGGPRLPLKTPMVRR